MERKDILWTHYFLGYWLDKVPADTKKVLDVGAGRGIVGTMLDIYRTPEVVHGIEIHEPYARFAKKFYSEIFVGEAIEILQTMGDRAYDVVTCFEVIEHLEKQRGYQLLREMERVGRLVFLSTPVKFFEQEQFDENAHQAHKSLWTPRELGKLGYEVRGFGNYESRYGAIVRKFLPNLCDTSFAWKRCE
jgi:2-polyprenyl-3-methyl-5-hydroxy-6-metoxy-1,4-benzoquinol methylase